MAKVISCRRGHATIIDSLYVESIKRNTYGDCIFTFGNVSDTAELRRLYVSLSQNEFAIGGNVSKKETWVDVSDWLPEYEQPVLVYCKGADWKKGIIYLGKRLSTDIDGERWSVDNSHLIKYWMPLPEAPHEYVEMQVSPLSVPYPSCKGPDDEGLGEGN